MISFAPIRVIRGFYKALRLGVLLAATVLAMNTFVALGWLRPVVVAGDSMAPALVEGERLWVSRWRTPRRWDVVVLRPPTDAGRLVVKRVVGLPGETVSLRGGAIWVGGKAVPPRNEGAAGGVYYGAFGHPTWRLGPDEWLVLGDHQAASIDSRNWPAPAGVPSRLLVGVVASER